MLHGGSSWRKRTWMDGAKVNRGLAGVSMNGYVTVFFGYAVRAERACRSAVFGDSLKGPGLGDVK
jgi:hypothetical protein